MNYVCVDMVENLKTSFEICVPTPTVYVIKIHHAGLALNEVMSNASTMVDAFDITSFEICVPTPTV